jgi:SAM-dependent methyltransferase
VDIGCGSAEKLKAFAPELGVVCVDRSPAIQLARAAVPEAVFIEWDLEHGLPDRLSDEILKASVVICADVVEHLLQPDRLIRDLARAARLAPFVLISTPDRDRARGLVDRGPPANPAHVMEWSASEFVRFLLAAGFAEVPFAGHTVKTDRHGAKVTTLVVTGCQTLRPARSPDEFRVAAVIHAYNEADILPEVVSHLHREGVEVDLVDNWSTDDTYRVSSMLLHEGLIASLSRFPERPTEAFEWARQLEYTERYCAQLAADWVMHHDADEIRSSPWTGVRLADALWAVEHRYGYNAVDFTVIEFRFLTSDPDPDPPFEQSLNWFEFGKRPGHFTQIKAWKNVGRADLVSSGGHEAAFSGRRVFPLKFLMKHYPLRSLRQAEQKIFRDRLPRFVRERQERGWHTQYDIYQQEGRVDGWTKHELKPWHPRFFETEFLVERLASCPEVIY